MATIIIIIIIIIVIIIIANLAAPGALRRHSMVSTTNILITQYNYYCKSR